MDTLPTYLTGDMPTFVIEETTVSHRTWYVTANSTQEAKDMFKWHKGEEGCTLEGEHEETIIDDIYRL